MSKVQYNIEFFAVSFPAPYVAHVEIDRADKMNAFRPEMWGNLRQVFNQLSVDPDVRAVILSGRGDKAFTAGLDVQFAAASGPVSKPEEGTDVGRRATYIRRHVLDYQDAISSIEKCEKPVITILHGYSYGAAIDIAVASDIRLAASAQTPSKATPATALCVKEVDLGLAADVGTLSRIQKIGVSYSWAKEVCYTARIFSAAEALRVGFVSEVPGDKAATLARAVEIATTIAGKSPIAVQSTKALLDWSRDRTVEDGLRYTAVWNAGMLQAGDVPRAMMGGLKKQKVTFEKL